MASRGGSIGGIWNQGADAAVAGARHLVEEEKSAFPLAILAES